LREREREREQVWGGTEEENLQAESPQSMELNEIMT